MTNTRAPSIRVRTGDILRFGISVEDKYFRGAKGLTCLSLLIYATLGSSLSLAKDSNISIDMIDIVPETESHLEIDGCATPVNPFKISPYELTNLEYAEFLNSVARTSDPYQLYSDLQSQHFWGGIVRTKSDQIFVYHLKEGYETLPATFVSWFDAARYANWLHYGRPTTGKSELGTTEGNDVIGAYDTTNFSAKAKSIRRNASARYFLPTCGEWLYAAYFDPKNKRMSKYSGGDVAPKSGMPQATSRTANFYDDHWAIPFPHLAPVNWYENSKSSLGTYNQSGNVQEWVETAGESATMLGGSLFLPLDTIQLGYRDSERPSAKLSSLGFRIAAIPQMPNSHTLNFTENWPAPHTNPAEQAKSRNPATKGWESIDFAGNVSDIKTGRGCVAYKYEMARAEITNQEYVAFLNAVASRSDKHRLYVSNMSDGVAGGIDRKNINSTLLYSVKPGFANRPASYISWFSLARFANWMHYGMPLSSESSTEGDSKNGAYDTSQFDEYSTKNIVDSKLFTRNSGALYFIPSDDEWYKAAYFDPNKPGLRKYWNYTGRMDNAPSNEKGAESGSNYQASTNLGEGAPYYVSEVGEFVGRGYFKIYDLGGNQWEWIENWRGLGGQSCWRCDVATKGLRGGSFNYIDIGLRMDNIDPGVPSNHYFVYGGRLARRHSSDAAGWCTPADYRYKAIEYMKSPRRRWTAAGATVLIAAVTFCLLWQRVSSRRPAT